MRKVLAGFGASATERPVLETALGIAELAHAEVSKFHIGDDDGPACRAVLQALAEPDVVIGVLSARIATLDFLEQTTKPVVVVPLGADGARTVRRLLVPLDGNEQTSRPVAEDLRAVIKNDVELIVIHVFTAATTPPVLDHPTRDLPILRDEFRARFCPDAAHVDLRTGAVGDQVRAAVRETDADLIVLSWSQDSSTGHAAVIQDVLGDATLPVLVLPDHSGGV